MPSGPGLSPLGGKGTRRSGTNADPPRIKIAVVKERDEIWNGIALARLQAPTIIENRHRIRRGPDPCSSPQTLDQTSIPRCTAVRSSLRTPEAPSRAEAGSGRTSRDPWKGRRRGGKEKKELRRFVFRTFDENLRYSSAFVPSEVEIETHSVPAPLAGT